MNSEFRLSEINRFRELQRLDVFVESTWIESVKVRLEAQSALNSEEKRDRRLYSRIASGRWYAATSAAIYRATGGCSPCRATSDRVVPGEGLVNIQLCDHTLVSVWLRIALLKVASVRFNFLAIAESLQIARPTAWRAIQARTLLTRRSRAGDRSRSTVTVNRRQASSIS